MQFNLPEKLYFHIQTKDNGRANIKKKFYQFSELWGQGPCFSHSIANSSLVPTTLYLHPISTQILALKKWFWNIFFDPKKVKKRVSKVAHNRPRPFYFTVQPRPTAHGPELIFHIMKSWDQTSVLLSVMISVYFIQASVCVYYCSPPSR